MSTPSPASAQATSGAGCSGAGREYPGTLAVRGASRETVERVRASGARVVAEIGIYRGYTSRALAEVLADRGELHLFDFEDRVGEVTAELHAAGYRNVIGHGNSYRLSDSYNWSLMRLLRENPEPIFDYVFLDGAHTWDIDALTFFLADRLLRIGGHLELDDYGWSLAGSPSLNPAVFPRTAERYTEEQIGERHVALIVDLLVRRDPRYREVVPARVFRKVAADPIDAVARIGVLERELARERADRAGLEEAIGDLDGALGTLERGEAGADREVDRRRTDLYRLSLAQHVAAAVRAVAPEAARVLVVSRADEALLALDGREGLHFPQDDAGHYAGHCPADTDEILARLEALRGRGAEFLVLPSFAFWWLEEYAGLHAQLEARYRRVREDAHCIVYRLGSAAGPKGTAS